MVEDKNTFLTLLSLIILSGFTGSYITYDTLNEDIQGLETQLQEVSNQERVVYVNDTGVGLESIFKQTEPSVVYINTDNSQGSGFVYSENGYIVTNQHVVEDSEQVEVGFTDGDTRRATVVGSDPYTDLAVLKVEKSNLQPLELSNSTDIRVGQTAIAIGNPFGLRTSMTQGIISQKGRSIRVEGGFSIRNVVQTDASINPGNSGGPLLNREGEIVGVNTAIETQTGTFSGVGFAVPSNTVERVIPELIDEGDYRHPWIGVRGVDVTPGIADKMDLENNTGFLVIDLAEEPNNPAQKAGIRPSNRNVTIDGAETQVGGDVIVGINGEKVRGIDDILEFLALRANVGDEITLEVIRDGERVEVPLKLQERP